LREAICLLVCAGCARSQISASDLQQVTRPAFLGRIEENAGPAARVFQEDVTYSEKLKRLDPKEADRRLQLKLARSVTRFEVSDRLRAVAFSQLPKERPWSSTIDPAAVAGALESFLVEHVPANPPDYDLLKPLGADAVVEFVVEEYGMRSEKGHSGVYALGHARLFLIDGATLWHRSFKIDRAADQTLPSLDPFEVAKEPERFRAAGHRIPSCRLQSLSSRARRPPRHRSRARSGWKSRPEAANLCCWMDRREREAARFCAPRSPHH